MTRNAWFEEVQKNVSDLIKRSPAADVERNVKAMLGQAFTRLDLVTREEFDIQVELLARTRARLEVLEDQLRALEQQSQAKPATPAAAPSPVSGTGANAATSTATPTSTGGPVTAATPVPSAASPATPPADPTVPPALG